MEKIDNYTLLKLLKNHLFYDIYLTSKDGTETKYVTLVLDKSKVDKKNILFIDREISILKDIAHPNIIKFIENKENPKFVYIILEYCNGGNLQKCLEQYVSENYKGFSEEIVQYLMKQIIDALKYIYNKGIIYRNIKLDNILINYGDEKDKKNNNLMKSQIKIIDFGFAKYLKKGQLAYTVLGSPYYMSPLLLDRYKNKNNELGYDEKEDIWSLGIVFYELLIGKSPFDADDFDELVEKVEEGIFKIPLTLSKEAVSFINSMIKYDPNKRLTIDELSKHDFLQKNVKEFGKNEVEIINIRQTNFIRIDDYELIKFIKRGITDDYIAYKKGTETKYFCKLIEKELYIESLQKCIEGEISILKEINHPYIIKFIDKKESSDYLFVILEYCNGENLGIVLEKYVNENGKGFSEEIVQYLMRQIIDAFKYLHNKGIIHRDIKLGNIMLNYENKKNKNIMKATIKIIDFGFAKHLRKDELAYSVMGSPINMSPIILKCHSENKGIVNTGYDEKEEIWSLGTIFYELLIGKSPFDSDDMEELVEKVEKGIYTIPSSLSKETVSFMNSMLQYDSSKRLSLNELYEHNFLKKDVKEFNKIDINEIKYLMNDSEIEINTKSNDLIWKIVGN